MIVAALTLRTAIRSLIALFPGGQQDRWHQLIIMAIPSFFAALRPIRAAPDTVNRLPLEEIRQHLHQVLHDCQGMAVQRVIYKINVAGSPVDLWLLRSDLYLCISRTHDQAEAARRVNALLSSFDGWMPLSQLTPI